MECDLQLIEDLMKLMSKHKIDSFEFEGIVIRKSRHVMVEKDDIQKEKEKVAETLFAASGVKPPVDFDMRRLLADPFSRIEE
jgi:hypothetical protein